MSEQDTQSDERGTSVRRTPDDGMFVELTLGKNLDEMYIASAHTKWTGKEIQAQWPHSGDIFKVDFGPGSEVRKLLGEDWKGAERHRFAA
jgi:hypothetical protein